MDRITNSVRQVRSVPWDNNPTIPSPNIEILLELRRQQSTETSLPPVSICEITPRSQQRLMSYAVPNN